ncbi:MAG TPA: hypothetical protein VLS28_11835 [Candidatus Sulfomarinibacteraceae bacterium]|nr:hypothetical protein [Candidatus Sulfomarinibacteraceae bacterium]
MQVVRLVVGSWSFVRKLQEGIEIRGPHVRHGAEGPKAPGQDGTISGSVEQQLDDVDRLNAKDAGDATRLPLMQTNRPGTREAEREHIELPCVESGRSTREISRQLVFGVAQRRNRDLTFVERSHDHRHLRVPKGQLGPRRLGTDGRRDHRLPTPNLQDIQRVELGEVDQRPCVKNDLHNASQVLMTGIRYMFFR